MAIYIGLQNVKYQIKDTPFASGGEGSIFYLNGHPDKVAKIFKQEKRTTGRERKLKAMMSSKPHVIEQYTWPEDVIYENGNFAGYVMPFTPKKKLREIYVYDNRKGSPWTLYISIAKNLSSAVFHFHEDGQIVGDLNPENVLVDSKTGLVTLADTDSYHFTDQSGNTHRCEVGMAEFVAPELQGKHFPSAPLPTFTKETDLFSLAVILFALLMNGAHPYACKTISGSASKFQPLDNIASGTCAYFTESSTQNIEIPRYAPDLGSLPKELQELFKRSFVNGHINPRLRPTAEEYYYALEKLERNIKVCAINSEHQYYYHAATCPWCKVDQKMKSIGQSAFNAGAISSGSGIQSQTPTYQPTQSASIPPPSNYTFQPTSNTSSKQSPAQAQAPVKKQQRSPYLSWKLMVGTGLSIVLFMSVGQFGAFILLALFYTIYYGVICYRSYWGHGKDDFKTGRFAISGITGFIGAFWFGSYIKFGREDLMMWVLLYASALLIPHIVHIIATRWFD